MLEQDATTATDLDALFNTVMDQEGGKSTLVSQTGAIPEQGKEITTINAEEPQTEEALQPGDGHIPRPEGTDDVIRSKSPQGGAHTPLGLDEPTQPVKVQGP